MSQQIEAHVVTFLERLERAMAAPLASKQSTAAAMVTHARTVLSQFADEVRSATITEVTPQFDAIVQKVSAERDEARTERDAAYQVIARKTAENVGLRDKIKFAKPVRNGKAKAVEARA